MQEVKKLPTLSTKGKFHSKGKLFLQVITFKLLVTLNSCNRCVCFQQTWAEYLMKSFWARVKDCWYFTLLLYHAGFVSGHTFSLMEVEF